MAQRQSPLGCRPSESLSATTANGVRLADSRKKRDIAMQSGNQAEPPAQLSFYGDVPCRYSLDSRVALSLPASQAQRLRRLRPLASRGQRSRSSRRYGTRSPGSLPGSTLTSTPHASLAISSLAVSTSTSRAATDRWLPRKQSPPANLKWAGHRLERTCCR